MLGGDEEKKDPRLGVPLCHLPGPNGDGDRFGDGAVAS